MRINNNCLCSGDLSMVIRPAMELLKFAGKQQREQGVVPESLGSATARGMRW